MNKGRGRRLSWISAVVLVSVAVTSVVLLRFNFRDAIDKSDILGGLTIKARYAITSGRGLAADSVTIACGLDKEEIEAVSRRIIAQFNLEALVELARKGQVADTAAVDDLGHLLGLNSDAVMRLLTMLSQEQLAPGAMVGRFAEVAGRRAGVVVEAPSPSDNSGVTKSPGQQRVLKEAEVLQAECAAVARIECGVPKPLGNIGVWSS